MSIFRTAGGASSRPLATRARVAGLAATIAIATGAAATVPSSASALTRNWNCGVIGVNTWCPFPDNHSWVYSIATWNGTAIPMCAKIINSADNDRGTRNCETAGTVYSIAQPSVVGPNTWALVANGNSGTSKTISGTAVTS